MHCMIDLETLGTGQEAVILSIGAVKFYPTVSASQGIADRFHVAVSPKSCQALGLKIDADTVMWWLHPDRASAREKLLAHEQVDLASALDGFVTWFGTDPMPVWSNGATFDIPIMRNAFAAIGRECPWRFWHERCYRTFKNLMPSRATAKAVAHDALEDAVAQAIAVQEIATDLGIFPE